MLAHGLATGLDPILRNEVPSLDPLRGPTVFEFKKRAVADAVGAMVHGELFSFLLSVRFGLCGTPTGNQRKLTLGKILHLTNNQSIHLICAESRARTGDPILFRDMLYQLSYLGKLFNLTTKTAISLKLTSKRPHDLLK